MPRNDPSVRFCLALTFSVVLVWHWPVLLGRQPAGSDATSFFYPLMVHYHNRVAEGELPLWNPLWGYGFPGLAESQMGVFYPPHLALFGFLDVNLAYSLNLLLHMLMAAGFAFWCARTFGLAPWGATLAAIVFARSGFFFTHLPHQWAYTAGCWLPLALLLAWKILGTKDTDWNSSTQEVSPPSKSMFYRALLAFGLSLVLAVQMLAGHFQLAFYTQVAVLLVVTVRLVQDLRPGRLSNWRGPVGASAWVVAAWISALGLAAVQLLPTLELIRYSSATIRHNFDYLSTFANAPWHFVLYFFPLFLQRNPLWRSVAWQPWHTSPEESFVYVGLLPLALAVGAAWRWRRNARVQVLAVLLVASLALTLGPFLPGFRALISLPGFGWFRSTARWSMISTLMLGLLAGFALDRLDPARLRHWMKRLMLVWMAVLLVIAGGVSVLLLPPNQVTWLARPFDTVWRWIHPWKQDADLQRVLEEAHRMQGGDFQVVGELVRLGYDMRKLRNDQCTLATSLPAIAWQEVAPSVFIFAALVLLVYSPLGRKHVLRWTLVVFTIADLASLGLVHRVEWIPNESLQESRLLRWLAENAKGQRVVSPYWSNLPLAAGAAPLIPYRTLEIPMFPQYLRYVRDAKWNELPEPTSRLLRLSAAAYHVVQGNWAHGMSAPKDPPPEQLDSFLDPTLDEIEFGRAYSDQLQRLGSPAVEYRVYRARAVSSRAWVVAASEISEPKGGESPLPDPERVVAVPLRVDAPEHLAMDVTVEEPSLLVVTDLYYPGWEATVTDSGGTKPIPLLKLFGAWRGVKLSKAGNYRIEMKYRCEPLRRGAIVGGMIVVVWALVLAALFARSRRERASTTAT